MGETANIAEIASLVSKEIFKTFRWFSHPKHDDNFTCVNSEHLTKGGKPKASHPGDVVFNYEDPYFGKRIYLHTDLKSYSDGSIKITALRAALKSLSQTVECARESDEWRSKYGANTSEPHEVRGLLFVHNHGGEYRDAFDDLLDKIDPHTLQVSTGIIIAFLGPNDIQRLWSIANDIKRLIADGELKNDYSFYYPDLVLRRRQGDVWDQAATIESLTGPFLFLKHRASESSKAGYIIYYNRPGKSKEEFEYFLDCLSRYQMLDSDEQIRIRVVDRNAKPDLKSTFDTATSSYARSWGFDPTREEILKKIEIDRITHLTSNFDPGDIGWRR